MKQKIKKIMISFFALTLIIFPFDNFFVSALGKESSFFEIESLEVNKNENVVMTINLDLIDYEDFNFKLESNKSILNIKIDEEIDEKIDLTNESNEEVSFDFNKNSSDLNQITFKYKIPNSLNYGETITFKATVSDNKNEDSELLELEYNVKIVETKTGNDNMDANELKNNENNNDKEMGNFESNNEMKLDNKTENDDLNTNTNTNSNTKSSNSSLSNEQVVTYNGSDNNYLSSLSITNYDLNKDFTKERLTYFTTVESDVTSLEINATSEDSNSIVSIYGNSNLSDGINKILITVTAENGNTKTYRIYVTKED